MILHASPANRDQHIARAEELIDRADILVADIEHACRTAAMRDARRMAGELRRLSEELLALSEKLPALLNDPEVSP